MRLIDYFRRAVAASPDRVAFVGTEESSPSLTYAQVNALAERIAMGLYAIRCEQASIAIYSPNHPTAFCAMVGVFRAGARWLPINVRNPVAANAGLLDNTDCQVLFYHSSLAREAAALRDAVPTVRHLVCLDGEEGGPDQSLDHFMESATQACPEPPDDPLRIETIFPTGGTTGLSKAAIWTQQTWNAGIRAFWSCLPTDRPATHLVAAPMTHAAGVVALMMMSEGTKNVVLPSADSLSILRAIEQYQVTHFYIPPTLLYNLLAHPRVREFDYSSLQAIVLAAAPVAPAKFREAMDVFGPVMCQSYGQAEAPMLLTFLSSRELLEAPAGGHDRWASCGRSTLGQRVEIMADDGRLLETGERGEIVARGDLVFGGYYKNPSATEEVSTHGWHHTGDVGFKDEHGFVYIVDRKKDMIVTGGFNVYSAEVEHVIVGHEAVEDCAVVGVPDEKWGEAVHAVIQLRPGRSATEQEIVGLVKSALGSVHAPKSVEFVTTLPRSPNGKVLKKDVRTRYLETVR